ncbi:Laminin subunit alpha-5 [Myotis brandtii]|uniref:Laminin subunit alpha-5 n=1 Tax=Myotis brandtii TaxID=109478 RepID=S7NSG6_MYOBR|nr:Laminin subunit alpha-5 [Myotis brandtii]
MVVRPRTRRGLLLLAVPLAAGSPSLALFLSHRYFVAQTQGPGPELRVLSHQRSKADQWHKVSVRWERTRIQLQVDGVWTQSQEQPGQEPGQQYQGAEGPQPYTLFVGGLPVHGPKLPVRTASPPHPLPGPSPAHPPQHPLNLTPCPPTCAPTDVYQQLLVQRLCEETDGGRAAPEYPQPNDTLGTTLPDVSLRLEVRPQTATGLIFHLGQFQVPPYLELQVLEKQVLLWADDGAGEFSASVTLSKELCDGQWHQLAGELGPLSHNQRYSRHPAALLLQSREPGRDSGGRSCRGQTPGGPSRSAAAERPSQSSHKEPMSHSDQKQDRPPAGGGLPEQPDPGSHAAGLRQHPSASALGGPAR